MPNSITHFSLFTGIGGIDLAAEAAGFTTVCQCEWAEYPNGVLEKHWPLTPRFKDITTVTKEAFIEKTGQETITLISGGFPCQPFSAIGPKRGFADTRYLWPEMCRVINELRPRWVLGENVANFVNMGLHKTLFDLEQAGYAVWTFVLPACAVGAWHERRRTFIVGVDVSHAPCIRHRIKAPCITGSPLPERGVPQSEKERNPLDGAAVGGCLPSGAGRGQEPAPQPGMGGMADGVPAQMDGNSLWAAEPPTIPRLVNDRKDRGKRLKTLGNAVVPAQVYPLLRYIADIELGGCRGRCVFPEESGGGI